MRNRPKRFLLHNLTRPAFVAALLGGFLSISPFSGTAVAQTDTGAMNKVFRANADELKIEALKDINSSSDDACPQVMNDGSIYFSTNRNGKFSIFRARRNSKDSWAPPEPIVDLGGKQNISAISIAGDGTTAVFGACNRPDAILESCDIYSCQLADGKLNNIVNLGRGVNSSEWEGQPCISQDGQLLIFASDRKGGKGGIDLYMTAKGSNGEWSEPQNLSFNTSSNESSPFLASDNQTLYFSSDASGGLGGNDIYMTKRLGPNEWTAPKNLGPSVNSKANEMFFSIPVNNDEGVYFSSDRAGGAGGADLYRVTYVPPAPKPKYITVTGRVLNSETGQPIDTKPEIDIRLATGEVLSNAASGAEYSVSVLIGSSLTVQVGADAYIGEKLEVHAPSSNEPPTYTQDVKLAPSHGRIDGHVTNVWSSKAVAAKITLEHMSGPDASKAQSLTTDANSGAYSFHVNPLNSYRIITSATDYVTDTAIAEVPASRDRLLKIDKEIRLQPTDIQTVILFFETAKWDLKSEESAKLEHFITQVKENPYVRIEVNGHTDDVGSAELNEKLSQKRASTVQEFLSKRGVKDDQLAVVKGFGMAQPIAEGTTDEARAKNRRVEVRIIGKKN